MVKDIAVIGAGSMGHGIAQTALQAGLTVYFYDIDEESLKTGAEKIFAGLDKMGEKGHFRKEDINEFKQNLQMTTDLEKAVAKAQFVFEAVPEVVEVKQKVFKLLDELTASDVILATNTSSIPISTIAEATVHKERVVGAHFFIPVVLMPIVEIIRGQHTSDEVMQKAYAMGERLGKTSIRVEKDHPGFIVNRTNAPKNVFLVSVVSQGWAKPEEIDALMRYNGLPIGQFELMDYVGLDVSMFVSKFLEKELHTDYKPNELIVKKVEAGELGRKTGRGFYDWSNGRPEIDLTKRTDKISIADIEFVKFNEAAKLISEGVASAKDIDLAMVLGTGYKKGPISFVKNYDLEEVIERLKTLSEQLNRDILKPAQILITDPQRIGL